MQEAPAKKTFPTWAIILITIVLTVVATTLVFRYYFFPSPHKPVALSEKENQTLDQKLQYLIPRYNAENENQSQTQTLEPEAYSELGAKREVEFSEREVNALLARNTDLADKLAIDLADDLVSAKLLVPLEPDFPIMGGKTVRINAGMSLSYQEGLSLIHI